MNSTSTIPQTDGPNPDIAKVCAGNGGMQRVRISGPLGQGEIYLHGAQVTSWKPVDHDEVLFLSSKSRWQEGQAIRGGIPICFPWFRAKADNPAAPAHGFARTRVWQLQSMVETAAGLVVTLVTESDAQTLRWWPAEFRLVYRVTFGSELRLELVCTNTGRTPLRFEEALHTYNRVSDVAHARVQGLENVRFLDNTHSNQEKTQHGEVAITSPTDSAYLPSTSDVDLLDPQMRRRIRLHKQNSFTTVVWNPWREGAAALRDLGDGEWAQFLCVEASNIMDSAVNLEPGEEHALTAVLSVETL
ncbi:MAG TPA: D-hexose-6-phosphate mutarotase [Terriglobales bacterium]|nr:D-hexose-6-phosphate mutarotase [Terriglobales bacterium]